MSDLVVGANKVRIIKQIEATMVVDRFVLEDGAVLKFQKGMTGWTVRARFVQLGRRTVIDGRGVDNRSKVARRRGGHPGHGRAGVGLQGATGRAGTDGGAGVDLNFDFGVYQIGGLRILVDGGGGGKGGQGQRGGRGRDADCTKRGKPGGKGGNGGPGGDGGRAGRVVLTYSCVDAAGTRTPECAALTLTVSALGGKGGGGGARGQGGRGGLAHDCGLYVSPKGSEGSKGRAGKKGHPGAPSSPRIVMTSRGSS